MGNCCGSFSSLHFSDRSNSLRFSQPNLAVGPGLYIPENQGKFANIYKVEKRLGKGIYCAVYMCTHKRTQQVRVVKIIYKTRVNEEVVASGKLLKEVEIHRTLDHPNIARFLEFFEDKKHYYFILELCEGEDLSDIIQREKSLSEAYTAGLLEQLSSTLAYIHSRNIIHRDIKPENIIVGPDGGLKLIDFDASVVLDIWQQFTRGSAGTVYYMAPEVLEKTYNEKCDIWSLGVLMYTLLTGKPPYDLSQELPTSSPPLLKDIFSPEAARSLSPEAKDLLKNMLTVDYEARYSAKEVHGHPWVRKHCKALGEALEGTLQCLKEFKPESALVEALRTFICTHIISYKDTKSIAARFKSLDKDGDGVLTHKDLDPTLHPYTTSIITSTDTNCNGHIDYTEFLKAVIPLPTLLSQENLDLTFRTFDKYECGYITSEELQEWLTNGNQVDSKQWKKLLEEAGLEEESYIDVQKLREVAFGSGGALN